jgi:hypothetical protein
MPEIPLPAFSAWVYNSAIKFEPECFGLHRGTAQRADLGDGHGPLDELFELRQTYMPVVGTCIESLIGKPKRQKKRGPRRSPTMLTLEALY